jgi:hypothetical protein
MHQLEPSSDLPADVMALLESEQLLTSICHVLLFFTKDQWAKMRIVVLKRLLSQVQLYPLIYTCSYCSNLI